jgi:hypothetical protein
MDNIFVGYKSLEREVKDLHTKREISLYEYEEIMGELKAFHNKKGEDTIFRISKDRNGKLVVDYSI